MGIQNPFFFFLVFYHLMLSGNFSWLGISARDFLGVKFCFRDFLGFDFYPHSIMIPVT